MTGGKCSPQEARIESLENHVDALATIIKRQGEQIDELQNELNQSPEGVTRLGDH